MGRESRRDLLVQESQRWDAVLVHEEGRRRQRLRPEGEGLRWERHDQQEARESQEAPAGQGQAGLCLLGVHLE